MKGTIWRMLVVLGLLASACASAREATPTPAPTQTLAPTGTPALSRTPEAKPTPLATTAPATPTPKPTPTPPLAVTGKPAYGGIIRARSVEDIDNFDLQRVALGGGASQFVNNLIFSPLGIYGGTECRTEPTPVAAKGWRWTDDLTFGIELRQGMKFHNKPPVNGREVTAEDAVFSIKRYRDVKPGGIGAHMLKQDVTSIETAGRYTIVMRSKAPLPALGTHAFVSGRLGENLVLAPESGDSVSGWQDPSKSAIGSGPFMFEQWRPGVKTVLARNPSYWKEGQPYVDRLEILTMPETSTAHAAIVSGIVNVWTDTVGRVTALALQANKEIQTYRCPGLRVNRIYMRWDKPPFNDVRIRRAVSMAIDQKGLLEAVLGGEGVLAGTVPPGTPGALQLKDLPADARRYFEYNPDESRRLLQEAGHPQGLKGLTLEYRRRGFPWDQFIEAIPGTLAKAGIEVKLVVLSSAAYTARTSDPIAYEHMATLQKTGGDQIRDGLDFDSKNRGANRSNINDPVVQAMVEEYIQLFPDNPRFAELWRQIQARGADQVHFITFPTPFAYAALRANIRDFTMDPHETGYPLRWAEKVWISR